MRMVYSDLLMMSSNVQFFGVCLCKAFVQSVCKVYDEEEMSKIIMIFVMKIKLELMKLLCVVHIQHH